MKRLNSPSSPLTRKTRKTIYWGHEQAKIDLLLAAMGKKGGNSRDASFQIWISGSEFSYFAGKYVFALMRRGVEKALPPSKLGMFADEKAVFFLGCLPSPSPK